MAEVSTVRQAPAEFIEAAAKPYLQELTSGSGGYAVGGRVGYGIGSFVRGSGMFQPISASMSSGDAPVMQSSGMGGMLSKLINNNPQLFKNVNSKKSNDFIDENFNGIDDRQEAAYGGRMKFAESLDPKIREIVIDLMDNEGFEFGEAVKEAYRRVQSTENKSMGGRMGYAMGSDDLVDRA